MYDNRIEKRCTSWNKHLTKMVLSTPLCFVLRYKILASDFLKVSTLRKMSFIINYSPFLVGSYTSSRHFTTSPSYPTSMTFCPFQTESLLAHLQLLFSPKLHRAINWTPFPVKWTIEFCSVGIMNVVTRKYDARFLFVSKLHYQTIIW